jgi:hypothetical protein
MLVHADSSRVPAEQRALEVNVMARRERGRHTLRIGCWFVLGVLALQPACGGGDEAGGSGGSGGAVPTGGGGSGAASGSGTNFFHWGVETSRVDYGSAPGQYDVEYRSNSQQDCTVAHSGSCSMRLDIIGDDGGNQSAGVDTIVWNPPYPFPFVGSSPGSAGATAPRRPSRAGASPAPKDPICVATPAT